MGSEAIQISIPDFDDDDYGSTPLFGRSQTGGLWGTSNSGQDSPTILTPLAERSEKSYFHAHTRGDSVASEDSSHSIPSNSRKLKTPFAHSAQSSVATTTSGSPFTKKTSFASLRNAFKSNKANDPPPPMPTLEQQVYPVLKNPFNRSATSLAHGAVPTRDRPSIHASPTQFRPSTPNSSDFKFRGTPTSKHRGHSYAKSQHSHSGSIFHFSDGGSDHGHGFSFGAPFTPPPVPPVPNPFGIPMPLSESPDLEEEKVIVEARTPSEFALHAIFIRFAASAESLMGDFVGRPLEREPRLETVMGPGVDPKFDDVLQSLGKIAEKHAKPVIDSIMRWRKQQHESIGREQQRALTGFSKTTRLPGSAGILAERKSMASIYIMCRALVSATQSMSKDSLPETAGNSLEELTFEQFKKPDMKLLTQSVNHRTMADLYSRLLGNLAEVRFESVTDRFITELGPIAAGQIPKEMDFKFENLVKGLKHIQIKVWPPERFEEGAEFLLSFAKFFDNAHGTRLKTVFSETLLHILHPIGKTAQAEVNDPSWAKAIELIYPKAKDMVGKPRYWPIAYQLAVTSLCVAPHELFLKHWQACFEGYLGKLKEKVSRVTIMNGSLRLIWTYLYRCNESPSTATSKLETLLKNFFPSNRITVFPQDGPVEPFVYMVHFVLSRYVDYGSELCMELLQERTISSIKSVNQFSNISSERISIAMQAILLSLHLVEREEPAPAWPSTMDFAKVPASSDYPTSSNSLSAPITRQGLQDLLERSSSILCTIALTCYQLAGNMSTLDEQWSTLRLGTAYDEPHNYIIRHHRTGSFAYPSQFSTPLAILSTCFRSWPRCLHSTLDHEMAFEMLLYGVVHIELTIVEAATSAVHRFMADPKYSTTLMARFCDFLFDPHLIQGEPGSGLVLLVECSTLLNLWIAVLDKWVKEIIARPKHELTDAERGAIMENIDAIEVGALFLLAHWKGAIRCTGVKAVQMLGNLSAHVTSEPSSPTQEFARTPLRVFEALLSRKIELSNFVKVPEDLLDSEELARLEQWRTTAKPDMVLRLADSDTHIDKALWRHIYPAFLQACMDYQVAALTPLRLRVTSAVARYHPYLLQFSGVTNRSQAGGPSRSGSSGEKEGSRLIAENRHTIHQWHLWMKIMSAVSQVPESRIPPPPPSSQGFATNRDHSRGRSEPNLEGGKVSLTTTRDIFKYMGTYLESDHSQFRDVAVSCVASFPAYGYPTLLEDLSYYGRQVDDARAKNAVASFGRARKQDRMYTAVARIHYLTAHLIKEQRSSAKQSALTNILKYIRTTYSFLSAPENRDLFSLQRLRRYFCGTIERLFYGLAELNDSDRFMPSGMQLALYRMCEEWCQLGKQSDVVKRRLIEMQTAAAKSSSTPGEYIQRFQTETKALSHAAVAAMAALVHKAFYPNESTGSPVDRGVYDSAKPLEAASTLDRIMATLASFHEPVQECGKKALRSLLLHKPYAGGFADEVLRRAFVTVREINTSNSRFFEVVAEVVCSHGHDFVFSQVVCLGMSNLCHPLLEIRRLAFNMLEAMHDQTAGLLSMDHYEAAIGSAAPSTYLHAHRLISDDLSGEHPDQALHVLEQFATWIPQVHESRGDRSPLVLLQSLEYWIPNINLMQNDKTLSPQGRSAIYHLLVLTSRYAETHAEQILVLWTRLVDAPYQINGSAIIRFLLDNSHKVGSSVFINCAAKVVACLSQSVVGRHLFEELCKVVEPDRMLPSLEYRETLPDDHDLRMWADLDVLFPEQPKHALGVAQFALLFLSETAIERYWEMQDQLPCLLHAIFMHLDYRQLFVRERVRHLLFQILRSCMSGYDELSDRTSYPSRTELKATISKLEAEIESKLWKEEDTGEVAEPKIAWLATQVISLLEPLNPKLQEKWGSKALQWGIQCSMRPIAVRSLQFFRSVMPKFRQQDLGMLLGRLSNAIADEDTSVQKFSGDMIKTLSAMASSYHLDSTFIPQLFWSAVACLSTTVESEYQSTLELLEVLLDRVDLDDPLTAELLVSQRPPEWKGAASMQSSLLTGLRSSATSGAAFKLLQRLAQFDDSTLIDMSEGRVRDLYTASLPWCLHAMSETSVSEELQDFAMNIGRLAKMEERPSITRIMTSFAKSRFRTKEDFLRQSIASLREHYGAEYWMEVLTLLMGLVLNNERWLRVHTMQILKVLFQQRETRNPIDRLGSELLMPLLRLLETDLASEALDVLDEPMLISGGPAAKHVLRMSLHHHLSADVKEVESVAEIFGIAEESGWCVPRSSLLRGICRFNMTVVFDTCKVTSRPSRINFQPEDMLPLSEDSEGENLGDLVQDLHELSTYFQDPRYSASVPSRQLEARVAAILAKSSTDQPDHPQTPFLEIFDMSSITAYDDSASDSGSDTESDVFEFDSPQITRYNSGNANNHH